MPDTASRLLRLLALLQSRPRWPGPELAAELGVSARTIRADIDRARDLGYEIDARPGTAGGYRLRPGTAVPPLMLDDHEALAVAVALHTVQTSGLAGAGESAVAAAAKLDRILPSAVRRRITALREAGETIPARRDPVSPDTLATVTRTCQAREQLRFDYTDRRDTSSRRHVEPHKIVHVSGRWYLAAYDLDRDDWRSFRLDRLTPHIPTGPRFAPRQPPAAGWEDLVTRGRMTALWAYRARVIVHADAITAVGRIPVGSWIVEHRTADTSWLEAGAHDPHLLAVYLGALDLDLTIDPRTAPDLHAAARRLAKRYSAAVTAPPDPDPRRFRSLGHP